MKPVAIDRANLPTGANSPLLGTAETQLELQLTEQLNLELEETHMEIEMVSTQIKQATTHDLRKMLESETTDQHHKNNIQFELEIRNIVNTSIAWGILNINGLEHRVITATNIHKMTVLAEAEHREDCGLRRETLLKKIRAALNRLERKTGMRMLHMAYHEYSPAPWYPVETYNPKKHAPNQQYQIKGVPIDPCLPFSFDNTPNEERDPMEVADWWGRAFVESRRNRRTGEILYVVRRLDGGAWDRSTFLGTSSSLEFSVNFALNNTNVMRIAA